MSSQWGLQKLLQRLVSLELTAYLSVFDLILTKWIMAILVKGCKPDNSESHNSVKLSFTNIWGLRLNFVDFEWLNWLWQFLCERLSSFNLKGFYYSYPSSCCLCEARTSFCMGFFSRNLWGFLLMLSTDFTSCSILLVFLLSNTFFVFMHDFNIWTWF